jgi:uncharacterized protein (UPF0335 family)
MPTESVAQDQLRAFVERIERMEEEKKAISDDIKEIYAEAKGNGFDTKVLRQVIRIRKQDRAERLEFEAILELYLAALGMSSGPTEDEQAEHDEAETAPPAKVRRGRGGKAMTEALAERAASSPSVRTAVENLQRSVDQSGHTLTITMPGHEPVTLAPRQKRGRLVANEQPDLPLTPGG